MPFKLITVMPASKKGSAFISTTSGMSGFFAVMYWWNPEGFWEPWDTGFGRYATEMEAKQEALQWGEEDGIPVMV